MNRQPVKKFGHCFALVLAAFLHPVSKAVLHRNLSLLGGYISPLAVINVHVCHGVPINANNFYGLIQRVHNSKKQCIRLSAVRSFLHLLYFTVFINPHEQKGDDFFIVGINISLVFHPSFLPFIFLFFCQCLFCHHRPHIRRCRLHILIQAVFPYRPHDFK